MSDLATFARYGLYLFLAAAIIDTVIALIRRRSRHPAEAATNFIIYVVGKGWRDLVMRSLELAFLLGIYQLAPMKLSPSWPTVLLAVLVADFTYYWKHRTEHGVRLLWAYHSVHHSSSEYNLTTAFRLPWLGSMLSMLFYVPMVLAGFHPLMVLIARQLVLLYQFWIHTESIGALGWFDRIFNSPANHRVHHGSNSLYLDKNHGGILILWDRLFGTYQAELNSEPVIYGLTHPLTTRRPVLINFHEPLAIWRDLRAARSAREALGYIFRGPGWRPATNPREMQPNAAAGG